MKTLQKLAVNINRVVSKRWRQNINKANSLKEWLDNFADYYEKRTGEKLK